MRILEAAGGRFGGTMVLRGWIAAAILTGISATAAPAFELPVAGSAATTDALLGGNPGAWAGAAEREIDLNRTPPLYEGDPVDDGARPALRVAVIRSSEGMFVRMRWTDPTDSAPREAETIPDAGEAAIYKKHSMEIERFADAACVMIPQVAGAQAAFPSLMMGEAAHPVQLYYWNKTRGFERLEAAGRGTTTRTGQTFPGKTRRTAGGWDAVFMIPDQPGSTPLSFAVWDGDRTHRDGLKYFSVWYELAP
jgi:DMSO reductase family type II enzyme heme b subunit